VKRSTLNVQRGDRKGVWWPGYGDRHAIWATGLWPGGPVEAPVGRSRPAAVPRYGDRHDVRYTDQESSTWNVQLSTFNGVTERADGGRDMGTDTELRVHLTLGFACLYCGVAICSVWIFPGRCEPGAGDKVEGDISQPGGAEISDQRANAPRLCASRNFGSGYARLGNIRAKGATTNRNRLVAQARAYRTSSCSIVSRLLPFVSGTRLSTNTNPARQMAE